MISSSSRSTPPTPRSGVMAAPRAPRRGGLDRAVLQPALGRGHRRQPPPGHHRPGAGPQPGDRRLHRPGLRREPDARPRCPGMPAYTTVGDIPDEVDVAIVAVPADAVQDVVLDCAAKGVHGLVVISSGFAETGEEGRQRQRRLVGLSRSYGLRLIGPNCLGIINTDPGGLAQRLAVVGDAAARPGRASSASPARSARRSWRRSATAGSGLSTFVSAGNRADVSGNDLLQYWEEDDATEVVLLYLESIGNPRKFSRIARRVSLRKPIIAVRSGRTTQGVPMGHAVRKIAAPPQAVDAMFRQAGVIQVDTLEEMFDVAQLLAHQPLPRGRRVAIVGNSDALGLLAADAAAAVGLGRQQVGRARRRGHRRGLRGRPRRRDRRPRRRLGGRGLHPAAQRLRRGRRQRAGRRGRAVRQAAGLVVPRRRGRARAAAGPRRRRARRPAAARCRRTPRSRPPSARSPASWGTPCGCAPRDGRGRADPDDGRPTARQAAGHTSCSCTSPEGADLDQDDLTRRCWRPTASSCGRPAASPRCARRRRPGEELGWDVVLKATADHLRERPDLAHVWRNIDTPAEMRDAWESLNALITDPERRGFVVQKNAPPGVPVAIRSIEDPLFGPVVSFGISGPLIELLADKSYRIPPLGAARRRRDGPRDQVLADAVRLPRQRGGRRGRGRAADPAGRPAAERPAAGAARWTCRWCSPAPRARPC